MAVKSTPNLQVSGAEIKKSDQNLRPELSLEGRSRCVPQLASRHLSR
jgi:hypothetical protein